MISGFDKNTVGKQTITIKYNGYTVAQTFEVTVIEKSVSDVKIAENNVTNIKEGKAFTFDGTILVSYNNDTTEKVAFSDKSVKVDASKVDTATPGTYKVTVVYTDKKNVEHTLTYDVTVIEKVLEKIAITTKPSKTSIIEGTKLDVTDGVITLYYDNDTTATVAMTNDMISGFDNSKVGDQTVTVTYKGKTAELAVTVAAKTVTDVTLVSAPTATTVTEGLALDLTGGKIHVTYDNGTEEDMDITEGMLTLDTNVVGKQTATVTYGGKTVTFEVEVLAKAATGLALSFGEVTDLKEGTELADAGLEVYLVYNNGTKDTLKLTDVTIKGYDPAVLGKQDVKVSYKTADGAAVDNDGQLTSINAESYASMNMWGLTPEFMQTLEDGFKEFFANMGDKDILKVEYLLPIYIDELLQAGRVSVKVLDTKDKWFGVTYKEDKDYVVKSFAKLIEAGVYQKDLFEDLK